VLEELNSRDATEYQPVHVININIEDNHEEATVGAFILSDLIDQLMSCDPNIISPIFCMNNKIVQ